MSDREEQLGNAWNRSYGRSENFVFWPCDEMVRFVSRYLRRRVGLDEYVDVAAGAAGSRVIDIGCGIGRNLLFGTQMGLEMYGCDLSSRAAQVAREWLSRSLGAEAQSRVQVADVCRLPWDDGFFQHGLSDSALDSMPFTTARAGIAEAARVIKPGGYFYLSLISGEGAGQGEEFDGEITVTTTHEQGTVQSYFNRRKIGRLLEPHFQILSCELHLAVDAERSTRSGRWHVTARRGEGQQWTTSSS